MGITFNSEIYQTNQYQKTTQLLCIDWENLSKEMTDLNYQQILTQPIVHCKILQENSVKSITASKGLLISKKKQYSQILKTKSIQKSQESIDQKLILKNGAFSKTSSKFIDDIKEQSIIQRQKQKIQALQQKNSQCSYSKVIINFEDFIKIRNQPVSKYYKILNHIGEGSFGNVYKGECIITGQPMAIKILKKKSMNDKNSQELLSQLNLLKKLDHPNIIKLYDLFFFNNFYYVVTEFCEGGPLLCFSKQNKFYNEAFVANIMKQLFSAVRYLHYQGIAHRDIKLQNIVFLNKIDSSNIDLSSINIKLIDFGLAVNITKYLKKSKFICGTLKYIAPEVLNGFVSQKCDIWSCGVILYVLLSGRLPFHGGTKQQLIQNIKSKQIQFLQIQWKNITNQAKNLILKMLEKKPSKRITAQQCLNSEWISKYTKKNTKQTNITEKMQTLENLLSYSSSNYLVAVINSFLAFKKTTQQQRLQLLNAFKEVDKDNSGMIDAKQLKQAYSKITGLQNTEQIELIIKKADHNNSGLIDFSQFIMVMYNKKKLFIKQSLEQAFDYFDSDKTGFLEKKQLLALLKGCQKQQINKIIQQLDSNGDNLISKGQFIEYLLKFQ